MVEEFGKRMRDARVAAGYSQRGLAKVLNISVEVLRRVEQGRGYPQLDSAAKIASALGTTVSALLGETEVIETARVFVQKMTEFGSAEAVKRLRELAEADKDGRVLVLAENERLKTDKDINVPIMWQPAGNPPKESVTVLARDMAGVVTTAYYNGSWHGMLNCDAVTHWMPLPSTEGVEL